MPLVKFRARLAQSVYDFLDIGKSPRPADCIFVLSGKQAQRIHGVKLWRSGYATELILCVGGFEWQDFQNLNLMPDGGLEAFPAEIPPERRHFLVRLSRLEAFCTPVRIGPLATRSEVSALSQYLKSLPVRSLLVVSSPARLRRVAQAFRRTFRKSGLQLTFVAVPERVSLTSRQARAEIWSEFCKYLLCRAFFL